MAAGTKPLAMFCDVTGPAGYFPEHAFRPLLAAGRVIRREHHHIGPDGTNARCLYYALRGEEWRIEAADAINRAIFTKFRPATDADDVRLGQLLGYSDQEIRAYLRHAGHLATTG